MKLTRMQLRRIIYETLSHQNESFLDTIKKGASYVSDKMTYGTTEKELLVKSSKDALALYNAMANLGTDESAIKEIIQKRSEDLDKLYLEFNNLIVNWVEGNSGLVSVDTKIKIDDYNQDLIAWLEGEGMDEVALEVKNALKQKNIQRKEVPAKVKRGIF